MLLTPQQDSGSRKILTCNTSWQITLPLRFLRLVFINQSPGGRRSYLELHPHATIFKETQIEGDL